MRYELATELDRVDGLGVWAFTLDGLSALCGGIERGYLRLMAKRACEGRRPLLVRASPGIYVNERARCLPADVRAGLVPYLRPREVSYLSLESVLSEHGVISQVTTAMTLVTTGDSRRFDTPWGAIDFSQTSREISPDAGVAFGIGGLPRATVARAWEDLQKVRRNLDLVDRDLLEEIIQEERDERPGPRP